MENGGYTLKVIKSAGILWRKTAICDIIYVDKKAHVCKFGRQQKGGLTPNHTIMEW